ncbi:MAG TPA: PIG-L family deacetylase [Phycisphaerae bacterium]|nr:PIG-L family deacetylase [Phycisphaerae bacterium]
MAQDQLDIVFTAPHPDDLEIGSGGTIARLVKLGYRVGMIHMTDGEPTPRGTSETRRAEAAAAARVLGAHVCEILPLTNRELMDTPAARYVLATALRKYRPRILVAMAGRTPAASPDHYQAQLLTEAARFYAQLTKWNDRFGGTEPHRIDHLLYRPVPSSAEIPHWQSRVVVDISETIEQKLEAVACYRSQFDGDRLRRLQHYIRSTAGFEGALCGFPYGELFALPRPVGTTDIVSLLGDWQIPPPFDGLQR